MLSWICDNLVTIIICTVLAIIVIAIIRGLVNDHKKGKSSCGGSCASCPMGGSCHSHN